MCFRFRESFVVRSCERACVEVSGLFTKAIEFVGNGHIPRIGAWKLASIYSHALLIGNTYDVYRNLLSVASWRSFVDIDVTLVTPTQGSRCKVNAHKFGPVYMFWHITSSRTRSIQIISIFHPSSKNHITDFTLFKPHASRQVNSTCNLFA